MVFQRIDITEKAAEFVRELQKKHGPLIFHQSGGCCDGSSPMCYQKGELWLNETDVWLGKISGCDFYMNKDQFEYWKHTHLTIDIVDGRGAGFSLEAPYGKRFIIISRLFEDHEAQNLQEIRYGQS